MRIFLDNLPKHALYYSSRKSADIAQSVERILGKDEVSSSNLDISSKRTPKS